MVRPSDWMNEVATAIEMPKRKLCGCWPLLSGLSPNELG